MYKVAKLKEVARSIAMHSANIGSGVPAEEQIRTNKNSARGKQSWVTRRQNVIKQPSS